MAQNKGAQSPVKIKKVSPYPITVTVQISGRPLIMQILKLTTKGFIADLAKNVVKVGDEGTMALELPVMKDAIAGTIKVMRTYDKFQPGEDPKGFGVARLAELHFLTFTAGSKETILRFINAIGQE